MEYFLSYQLEKVWLLLELVAMANQLSHS
ncbi:unnamed protein product, partial [Vitis vinifera]|uniref:Uncharacterized protein n=1 Tax=Vitis vinifera TaxID=29760 RepID=D7ST81_VITVI